MRTFWRYGLAGALSTGVHYLVLVAGVEWLRWDAWSASAGGALTGAQVAYVANRGFTFAHRGSLASSWLRFQCTAVVGAIWGAGVVALGVRMSLHYLLAQMLATSTAMVLTFAINRAWSFR